MGGSFPVGIFSLGNVQLSKVFMSFGSCSQNVPGGSANEKAHQAYTGLESENPFGDFAAATLCIG